LVGCNGTSTQSLIIDDRSDHAAPIVIAYVQTTWGSDEVWYDSGSNHYYLAQNCTPDPTTMPPVTCAGVTVMNVEDAGPVPHPDKPADTAFGSRNAAADPDRNLVYLPIVANHGTINNTICSTNKDHNGNAGNDEQGCIAIYTARLGKDDCLGDDEHRGDDEQGSKSCKHEGN
jgi:hypothetical protein